MARPLAHRGPDDAGAWTDPGAGVVLAHTRLAVIDPTPHGSQPMISADGRHVLVFNGEIYNHRALRAQLGRPSREFRGESDTETLIEAIARWGVVGALERADGMFAFAVWDRQRKHLTLARDRVGEKPLYYGWIGQQFAFGSELKALRALPEFAPQIDRSALTLYFRFGYLPAPTSIYQGISKLSPGTVLEVPESASPWSGPGPTRRYWSLREVAGRGAGDQDERPAEAVVDELEAVLSRSVQDRMVADVPLGAFLSGGIDSTAIVAMMQRMSRQPVQTFTIAVDDSAYDESRHAAAVAAHLGTEHTEMRVTGREALELVPSIPHVYDEPFADSSQIPTMLISELTRKHVTVALSGDGGDELFGGYTRYLLYRRIWDQIGWLPARFRELLAGGIKKVPDQLWDRLEHLPGVAQRVSRPREKAKKLAAVLPLQSPEAMYRALMSQWSDPAALVLGADEPAPVFDQWAGYGGLVDPTQRLMLLDSLTYLPDDILTKVDRASMAASLEVRVPFLAREVIDFAWGVPIGLKIRESEGKWVLRQLVDRHVPRHLMERPKMGFGIPLGDWLRGPLRPWAEDLLSPSRLRSDGYLAVEPVRHAWRLHLAGADATFPLWTVLMFQAWVEQHTSHATVKA